jgi:hypothetical protein
MGTGQDALQIPACAARSRACDIRISKACLYQIAARGSPNCAAETAAGHAPASRHELVQDSGPEAVKSRGRPSDAGRSMLPPGSAA